jgi:hypothetical protein
MFFLEAMLPQMAENGKAAYRLKRSQSLSSGRPRGANVGCCRQMFVSGLVANSTPQLNVIPRDLANRRRARLLHHQLQLGAHPPPPHPQQSPEHKRRVSQAFTQRYRPNSQPVRAPFVPVTPTQPTRWLLDPGDPPTP